MVGDLPLTDVVKVIIDLADMEVINLCILFLQNSEVIVVRILENALPFKEWAWNALLFEE